MKPNKVGQDFYSPGIKHPCAIDNRQAQLNESRKFGRWFWPLCVAGYAAILYLFYLIW